MEDLISLLPKLLEYGPLGVINVLLIFKGIPAIKDLSASISKLADKVDTIDDRVIVLERDIHECLRDVKNALDILNRRFFNGTSESH